METWKSYDEDDSHNPTILEILTTIFTGSLATNLVKKRILYRYFSNTDSQGVVAEVL